jgi:hypothetical protein
MPEETVLLRATTPDEIANVLSVALGRARAGGERMAWVTADKLVEGMAARGFVLMVVAQA